MSPSSVDVRTLPQLVEQGDPPVTSIAVATLAPAMMLSRGRMFATIVFEYLEIVLWSAGRFDGGLTGGLVLHDHDRRASQLKNKRGEAAEVAMRSKDRSSYKCEYVRWFSQDRQLVLEEQ